MDISAALAADLAVLTEALDDPGIDLEAGVRALAADLEHAIPSYTGMTMTIALDGGPAITFTAHADATSIPVTSLLIPLPSGSTPAGNDTDAARTLLLHAATPGAFVDLAADLSYALGVDPSRLVLDGHLEPPTGSAGLSGLDDHSAINQAVGILVARGHTPDTAREQLQRLAASDHGDLHAAAEALIRNAGTTPTDTT